ncbi:MAG: thiamine biosynthesis protein ThiS [Nitrosopumilus sp. H8]|nr:MAG: thiamine biosynthesis protein ThiS [Nitrosopumilus sp. H8]
MITIKPVGGAKKSLGTDEIRLESGVTITEMLDALAGMVPDRAPELDTDNVLVAVNGADSSAMNGRNTVLNDGDKVSIIPVIHGGSQNATLQILQRHVLVTRVTDSSLDDLRSRHPGARLQAVSERFILNRYHLERILHLSIRSHRNGSLLSKKIETDILMRFALTRQISAAIADAGARPGKCHVIIALGTKRQLELIRLELLPVSAPLFCRDNSSFLRKHFGITKKHVNSVRSGRPLEDILAEKAAVLL